MKNFLPSIDHLLKQLDGFLTQFSAMIKEQRDIETHVGSGGISLPLSQQMLHAGNVVESRRRDIVDSIDDQAVDRFVHELWSLAGDMPRFEFNVGHLAGADIFVRLREDVALQAMTLTNDLTDPNNKAAFVAELAQRQV